MKAIAFASAIYLATVASASACVTKWPEWAVLAFVTAG